MALKTSLDRFFYTIVVVNYYLAALLLIIAGILKAITPSMSDLHQALIDLEFLEFDTMIVVSNIQPWLEVGAGCFVFLGWHAEKVAKALAVIFIFFGALILYASQGYLTLPMDCGCFGDGDGMPVYWYLIRNILISLLLFLFDKSCRKWTLYYGMRLKGRINER